MLVQIAVFPATMFAAARVVLAPAAERPNEADVRSGSLAEGTLCSGTPLILKRSAIRATERVARAALVAQRCCKTDHFSHDAYPWLR